MKNYYKTTEKIDKKKILIFFLFLFVTALGFGQSLEAMLLFQFDNAPLASLSLQTNDLALLNRYNGQFRVVVEDGSEDAWKKIRDAYNLKPIEAELRNYEELEMAMFLNYSSRAVLFLVGSNNPAKHPVYYSDFINSGYLRVMNDPKKLLFTPESNNAEKSKRLID